MRHFDAFGVARIYQVEFNHQLTTITTSKTKGIGSLVKIIECNFRFFVTSKSACPTFSRATYIGVVEPSNKNNQAQLFKCLASAEQVGHMDIFHIKSGKIHAPCHFAVSVTALFTDNG